jgi:hypothetical protein
MDWHIINHRDYIDGAFPTFEDALKEAMSLGRDIRPAPRVKRRAADFFVYRPPYDKEEHWQAEYWICTKPAALALGVPEARFEISVAA